MRRPSRALALAVATALVLVAVLLDVLFEPAEGIGVLYAIPLLTAALSLSPKATAAFAAIVLLLSFVTAIRGAPSPAYLPLRSLTLAVVGLESYLLASRIRAVEERDTARRGLEQHLGLVAHELGNQLAVILGYAQLLDKLAMAPEQARMVRAIQAQAERAIRIVTELADAARIGAGVFLVRPRATDLVSLARGVIDDYLAAAPRHSIRMEAPDNLRGEWDAERLAQVMDNLVGNAIKYSPQGGQVLVRIGTADDEAEVSVSDQGVGVRPEDLPRLFQPYSRLAPEQQVAGTGLGLYITRGIIEAHGGRLWATSPGPGEGTTFTFVLPLRPRRE